MPHFHVAVRSTAYVRAEFDIAAPTQREADVIAIETARAGDALWKYDGLVEDAPIEVDR